MPRFNFVAQFPIEDESLPLTDLRDEGRSATTEMIHRLGFGLAGDFTFSTLDLPLAMHLQCAVPVDELRFTPAATR
jgi:hypothetical protein